MMPGDLPLAIYRGDSYDWQFTLWADEAKTIEADLTGATAKAEIRDAPGGALLVTLDCTIDVPNIVNMRLDAGDSGTLPATGVWDLQLTYTASGNVTTVLSGAVTVTADVTDSGAAALMVGMPAARRRVVR